MKIGFIGVGNMGGPMCRNIVRNTNHQVVVFDLNPDAAAACTALGASAAASVAALAAECDVILTSLPMPSHVEAVALGADGIAAHARAGSTYIDLSTNAPETARKVAAAMAARGIAMLEAPVSGGTARAEAGTIVIMVGGETQGFEAQRPLLASFSAEQVHVGEVGMGSTAKLINNMLAFCNAAAAAEALALGAAAGIDMKKLYDVISNASGDSPQFRKVAQTGFAGDFSATFALDLAHKDLRLALAMADGLGVPGMIAPQVMTLMRIARAAGYGGQDSAAVLRVYEDALRRPIGR
ncbi:MAG: NAD(P)-dependent oxidoreductase [Rhodospirillales bacterium]|nr:NAD(P)-dependent oxidoreductase [Rhodospirillales bacterium]